MAFKLESCCSPAKFWQAFNLFYFRFIFQVGQPSVGNNIKFRLLISWNLQNINKISYEVLELTAVITSNFIIVLRLPAEQKWLTKLKLVGRFELRKELTVGVNRWS